jgi:hypothetical protein
MSRSRGCIVALVVCGFAGGAQLARAGVTQACCAFNGSCVDLTVFECANSGGTPQGAGTMCLGDSNGNMIDDACDTQACCGVGETGCEDRLPADCGGESGGTPQGPGTMCEGDNNENGTDDACEAGGTFDAVWIVSVGDYATPASWDINTVPCNSGGDIYNVTIDTNGAVATLSATACAVDTLMLGADRTLNLLAAAGYTVANGGALRGHLNVDSSSFASSGLTNIDGSSLSVTGGTLSVLGAGQYARTAGANGDNVLLSATGGLLDLAAVGSIDQSAVGGAQDFRLGIEVASGGTVDLGSVLNVQTSAGRVEALATGAGSAVNLASVTSWTDATPSSPSVARATAGASINLSNAQTLDAVNLHVDTTGVINLGSLVVFRNASATADGGNLNLAGVTDFDDSAILVSAGSEIVLGTASDYSRQADADGDARAFLATGPGSALRFPALTTITQTETGTPVDAALTIAATDAGTVGMPALTSISGGAVQMSAIGSNSVVDCAALASWTASNPGTPSSLVAESGGVVRLNSLSAVTGVDVTLPAGGTIRVPQLFTVSNAHLTYAGGDFVANSVRLADGTLTVFAGPPSGLLQFSVGGVSTLASDVPAGLTVAIAAEGVTPAVVSTSDFDNFGHLALQPDSTTVTSTLSIPGGSVVNRPGALLNINPGQGGGSNLFGGVVNDGEWRVRSGNAPAQIGSAGNDHLNAGTLEFIAEGPGGVVFIGSSLVNEPGGVVTGFGTVDVSGLIGFFNEGVLSPSRFSMDVGRLDWIGDFDQNASGELIIDLGGALPGTNVDQVTVTGTATLAGTLTVVLDGGFDPPNATSYPVLTAGTVSGAFDTVNLPGISPPLCLDVVYSASAVTVVATQAGIAADPQDQLVCEGAAAEFTVTPVGIGNISYQWRRDGVPIGGATTSTLTIDPVAPADAGAYDVVVTSACGVNTSGLATLAIVTAPPGDLTADCEVDDRDLVELVACLTGPGGGVLPGCAPADLESDADVDLADYARLQTLALTGAPEPFDFVACLTGPGGGILPGCQRADFDDDGDVDLGDYASLQDQ